MLLLNLFKLYWKSMCSQKTWTTMSADEFWKRALARFFQNTSIMNTCIDIHLSFALLSDRRPSIICNCSCK